MSRLPLFLSLLAAFALAPPAFADTEDAPKLDEPPPGWNGTGELGAAAARGNSTSENLNARFNAQFEDADWKHSVDVFGLRASAEVDVDDDGDGVVQRERRTTANRYTAGASTARKLDERSYWNGSLRYEQDDFASYTWQQSVGIGYGKRLVDSERARLAVEVGPGYRRARDVEQARTESGFIGRSFVDFKYALTDNTELVNTLLVESGTYNTFAQNDLGLSVAMNAHLALKAGFQARHNSDASADRKNTDTLTTMNVVYRFK